MEYVSLRNTVCSMSTNPAHNLAAVTEEVTVESGKSTTREGKLGSAVVGEERVCMLKEGNQDKPVVNPNR